MTIIQRIAAKWHRMTRQGMKNIFSDIYKHNEWGALKVCQENRQR